MKQQLLLFWVLVDIGVWHDGEKDVFNNTKGFTETAIKEIATYGYTSVYVCVEVCDRVAYGSPCVEWNNKKQCQQCVCECVCEVRWKEIKRRQWTETGQFKIVLLFPLFLNDTLLPWKNIKISFPAWWLDVGGVFSSDMMPGLRICHALIELLPTFSFLLVQEGKRCKRFCDIFFRN